MEVLVEMMDGRVRAYSFNTEALRKSPKALAVEEELRCDRILDDGELRLDITVHELDEGESAGKREVTPGIANEVALRTNVASVLLLNLAELDDAMRVTVRSGEERRVVFWREGIEMMPVIGQDVERERLRLYENDEQAAKDKFCLEAFNNYLARDEVWSWPDHGEDDVEKAMSDIAERLGHPFGGMEALSEEMERRAREEDVGGQDDVSAPDEGGDGAPEEATAPANDMAAFIGDDEGDDEE